LSHSLPLTVIIIHSLLILSFCGILYHLTFSNQKSLAFIVSLYVCGLSVSYGCCSCSVLCGYHIVYALPFVYAFLCSKFDNILTYTKTPYSTSLSSAVISECSHDCRVYASSVSWWTALYTPYIMWYSKQTTTWCHILAPFIFVFKISKSKLVLKKIHPPTCKYAWWNLFEMALLNSDKKCGLYMRIQANLFFLSP